MKAKSASRGSPVSSPRPPCAPTDRCFTKGGYDTTTQLFHLPSLELPDLPDRPSREQALAALALLTDLLAEFSFVGPLDRAVALSGILTVLVRGSLQTAPIVYHSRAHSWDRQELPGGRDFCHCHGTAVSCDHGIEE